MSAEVPEVLDAWRMAAARRAFAGRVPLSAMPRLRDLLADAEGEARFSLEFGHDALKVPFAELQIDAELPLVCQRSLQRFLHPVSLTQRYALVREAEGDDEDVEAALPTGYEALMVADDGLLRPAELVEDELILAVPLVPAMPGVEPVEHDWPVPEDEGQRANPFAALAALKKT
ncbi:MAG: YceD family protein [Lysobacteraceae bacterium]